MNDNRAIEQNDLGALTDDQQSKLNLFKVTNLNVDLFNSSGKLAPDISPFFASVPYLTGLPALPYFTYLGICPVFVLYTNEMSRLSLLFTISFLWIFNFRLHVWENSNLVIKISSADLEVQLVQLNHCDGVYITEKPY